MLNILSALAILSTQTAAHEPKSAAPPEMEAFSFLLGERQCDGVWRVDGETKIFRASWRGRLLLDGLLQIEEYKAWRPDGDIFVFGVNTREYDTENRRWKTWWRSAIDDLEFELGQPQFDEKDSGERAVAFINGEGDNLQRAIYRVAPDDRMTWQGDGSSDGGETWGEAVMTIACGPRRQ